MKAPRRGRTSGRVNITRMHRKETNMPKHGDGLIEQTLGVCSVAGRKVDRRHSCQRIPDAPPECQGPVSCKTVGVVLPRRVHVAQ